jgi:hypothetical protein
MEEVYRSLPTTPHRSVCLLPSAGVDLHSGKLSMGAIYGLTIITDQSSHVEFDVGTAAAAATGVGEDLGTCCLNIEASSSTSLLDISP